MGVEGLHMQCQYCNEEVPEDVVTCPGCGEIIDMVTPPSRRSKAPKPVTREEYRLLKELGDEESPPSEELDAPEGFEVIPFGLTPGPGWDLYATEPVDEKRPVEEVRQRRKRSSPLKGFAVACATMLIVASLLAGWYMLIYMKDTDGDGVPDRLDAFPNDSMETHDYDGDGWGDNSDAFPDDPREWTDTDSDGHGDNGDAFPSDPTEWADTDGDRYGDNIDRFPEDPSEWRDLDCDGHGDNGDAFPLDPSEWGDADTDGFGDNSDAFPQDPSEWVDSDGDGIGDNADEDDDNDGIDDDEDEDPDGNAMIEIVLLNFTLLDPVDEEEGGEDGHGDIWFVIVLVETSDSVRFPKGGSHRCEVGVTWDIQESVIFDIPDDTRRWTLDFYAWDLDEKAGHDQIDLSSSASMIHRVVFNIQKDELKGSADGSKDGSKDIDENDGLLEYIITVSYG